MAKEENSIQKTADKLSRYICICAYVCLYPALYGTFVYNIGNAYQFLNLYSDALSIIFWFTGFLFIPAGLWLLLTRIFKKIHPLAAIIYFSLFVIMQIIDLLIVMYFLFLHVLILLDTYNTSVNF